MIRKIVATALMVGAAAYMFWAARPIKAETFNQTDPKIYFQTNNPGWCAQGSIWLRKIGNDIQLFVQTNTFNTNGIIILSNVVIATVPGGIIQTSITVVGTNTYPAVGWATNTVTTGLTI